MVFVPMIFSPKVRNDLNLFTDKHECKGLIENTKLLFLGILHIIL